MSAPSSEFREKALPTRKEALWFGFRAMCFRARRLWQELQPGAPRRMPREPIDRSADVLAESRSLLFAHSQSAEFALQAGKVQNLRIAARMLDGLRIGKGETFSFWKHVGRPVRSRGFVPGRELREGCIIPSVGGGLCQLSNALYDGFLDAGFEIVERHAHSQRVPGSMAVQGRDATIFWNYVDLRARANFDWQLEARLSESELHVCIRRVSASKCAASKAIAPAVVKAPESEHEAESCETCGVASCFRNPSAHGLAQHGITAWLVDVWQPEHDRHLRDQRAVGDWLFTPLDSSRRGVGPYRWSSRGFAKVVEAPLFVAERSWRSRRLAAQGALRQRTLLALDEKLARLQARRLPPEATHLVVSQSLLPFLWRDGVLGGRTFDVLMTRLPLAELETVLDRAAAAHPESRTLADFRAPIDLLAAETEALSHAQHWITPHRAIGRLANGRAVMPSWDLPRAEQRELGDRIVFPASTLGRKGAYELRDAMRSLDLPLRICGPVIEDADFWRGIPVERSGDDWLTGARCVVFPAWVEHQPRRLLQALAAGVPVIASEACGLESMDGLTIVPTGDSTALGAAMEANLAAI